MNAREMATQAVEGHGAMQKVGELAAFIQLLSGLHGGRRLHGVLEIGGMHGGTMWCWEKVSDGRRVCVDAFVLEGRMEKAGTEDYTLIYADSHLEETRDAVVEALGGEQVDLLFIDGDHSLLGVTTDFQLYAPLVRSGGVIALHNTAMPHENVAEHEVIPLWDVARRGYPHVQIYDPTEKAEWGGIGVLLV